GLGPGRTGGAEVRFAGEVGRGPGGAGAHGGRTASPACGGVGGAVVVTRRRTAPCAAPSVTDVRCCPARSRYVPPSATVCCALPGRFRRTMPPSKSRRTRPFQRYRSPCAAPRTTPYPDHQSLG